MTERLHADARPPTCRAWPGFDQDDLRDLRTPRPQVEALPRTV